MKKTFLGAVLFLVISATQVTAADCTTLNGQPRTERNILSNQLPTALLAEIKRDYKDYWITELSQEGKSRHPDYSITLENADQVVRLHSSDSKNWVIINASVKSN
jgi:hypothetical protein